MAKLILDEIVGDYTTINTYEELYRKCMAGLTICETVGQVKHPEWQMSHVVRNTLLRLKQLTSSGTAIDEKQLFFVQFLIDMHAYVRALPYEFDAVEVLQKIWSMHRKNCIVYELTYGRDL